ncbi:MAG TPA: hypothetical protein VEB22_06660 [Phycisphaerales bacterium]|nr:hypothetical protein [Phycisphaerales bacterium]
MRDFLFNLWWLVLAGDGVIAFGLAVRFWRRRADPVAFWTAVMLACFAAEALARAAWVGLAGDPACSTAEGLGLSVGARAVKATGMWLWWLNVFNGSGRGEDGH